MSKQPEPWIRLSALVKQLRLDYDDLKRRSPFFETGMHPNGEGGIDSDNFVAGVSGYSFGADGNAEFNDLTLRGGIIGNDALTNPVRGDVAQTIASNFALTTSFVTLTSETWTVPAGFNQAQISGIAKTFAVNPTAGLDYLYSRSRIVRISDSGEVPGIATPTAISASGGSGTSLGLGVAVVALAAGDQVRLEVQARTAFAAWAADVANSAEWTGTISWFRT